jgi:predicted DNA-binding transcriptional regulator YafY
VLQPYGIGYWRAQWYAVGHDLGRDATRTFRLSRATAAVATGEANAYAVPVSFRLDDHLNRPAWALRAKRQTAEIEIDPAWRSRAETWFGLATFDGAGVARVPVSDPAPLFRLLIENADGLRLVGSAVLVKQFRAMIESMQEDWQWTGH